MTAVIEVHDIWKFHLDEPVLRNVSLSVEEGVNLGLIGPGGAGKSLLTKIIVGLVKPESGRVLVGGADIHSLSEIELAGVRDRFGMLFQNYALFDFMNVGDNIAFPLRQAGELDEASIGARVDQLLRQVDLPGIQHLQVNELSGGMKKRVSFARAIIRNPPILIYDDPTAGLDPVTSSKIFILLKAIKEQHGTTSITISHDLYGMREVCDAWAMLYEGELVFFGTREEIERCPTQLVREFWEGGMNLP